MNDKSNDGTWYAIFMLIMMAACATIASVAFNPYPMKVYAEFHPQSIAANPDYAVPTEHTVMNIEEYSTDQYYRVIPGTERQAGYLEYRYLPCELAYCVPNSVRYGVEEYGGCLAVLSKDGSLMIDIDACGPFFDGTMP